MDYTLFFLMLPFLHAFTMLFLALCHPLQLLEPADAPSYYIGRCWTEMLTTQYN